jgi:hypothetical protein
MADQHHQYYQPLCLATTTSNKFQSAQHHAVTLCWLEKKNMQHARVKRNYRQSQHLTRSTAVT